jgi:hypothetical protein
MQWRHPKRLLMSSAAGGRHQPASRHQSCNTYKVMVNELMTRRVNTPAVRDVMAFRPMWSLLRSLPPVIATDVTAFCRRRRGAVRHQSEYLQYDISPWPTSPGGGETPGGENKEQCNNVVQGNKLSRPLRLIVFAFRYDLLTPRHIIALRTSYTGAKRSRVERKGMNLF